MKLFTTLFSAALLTLTATADLDAQVIGSSRDAMVYRGDANGDGMLDRDDYRTVLGVLFFGAAPTVSTRQLDANEDGEFNIADAIALADRLEEEEERSENAPHMGDVKEVLGYLFGGDQPTRSPRDLDYNRDGRVDLSDAFKLLDEIHSGPREAVGRPEPITVGDLTDDGSVDIADWVAMLHLATSGKAPAAPREAADINGDGRIDVADLTWLGGAIF